MGPRRVNLYGDVLKHSKFCSGVVARVGVAANKGGVHLRDYY